METLLIWRVKPQARLDAQLIPGPRADARPQRSVAYFQLHFHLAVIIKTLRHFCAQNIADTGLQRRLQDQGDIRRLNADP